MRVLDYLRRFPHLTGFGNNPTHRSVYVLFIYAMIKRRITLRTSINPEGVAFDLPAST